MKEHARFSVCGKVTRVWANDKGTFARLSVEAADGQRTRKVDMKVFSVREVSAVARLKEGDFVTAVGDIGVEKLTSKDRQEIQADGRPVWAPSLVLTEVKLQPVARQQPARSAPEDDEPIL